MLGGDPWWHYPFLLGVLMLQKQVVSIATLLGLDQKTAPALVAQNKFLLLHNAVFDKAAFGGINKRNGYSLLNATTDLNGNVITGGQSIIAFGDELDLIAEGNFYALSQSQGKWAQRGTVTNIVPTETTVVDNNYIQSNCDACTFPGFDLTVYSWEDTRGGVWYKVLDEATGSVIKADTQLLSTGMSPRVVAIGADLAIFCASSNTAGIFVGVVPILNPTATVTASSLISATLATATTFEVLVNAATGNAAIAYDSSLGYLTLANLSSGLAVSNTTVYGVSGPTTACTMCVSSDGLVVNWTTKTGQGTLYSAVVKQDLVSTSIYSVVTTLLGSPVTNMASAPTAFSGQSELMLSVPPNGSVDWRVFTTTLTHATPGSFSVALRGMALASEMLTVSSINYYLAVFPSAIQQTYFLMAAATGAVVGRFMYSNAGPTPSHPRLPNWTNPTGSVWIAAVTQSNVFLTSAGGIETQLYGVTKLALDFGQTTLRAGVLGRALSICGAVPQIYDGTTVVEAGFNQYPEGLTAVNTTSNLAITNIVLSTTTITQSFSLVFPTNQASPGHDGVLMVPGDYFILSSPTALYFYWNRDGQTPSPPTTGPTGTWHQIAISGVDSAATIATKSLNVISPLVTVSGTTYWEIAQSGGTLNFTINSSIGTSPVPIPGMRFQFEISQVAMGGSTGSAHVQFSAIPASVIAPGQYFTFQAWTSTLNNVYVWFTINGVGIDPNPFGAGWYGVKVALLSSDLETSVATKIQSALNAATSLVLTTDVSSGTLVDVFSDSSVVGTNTSLGTNGNLGQGFIGVTGVSSTAASYQYVAVYEWVDAKGQIHRSAPSVPVSVGIGASGLQIGIVQVTVKTLRLSARTNVDIAIYRTTGNGTLFQRVTSSVNLLYNAPGSDTVTFIDSVPDSALVSGEFLYTTGGVAQNDQPPAMTGIHSHLDRLWGYGLEDPQLLWWSKFSETGVAIEWSALQTTRIDIGAGPILKLMTMDSNLIIFCQNEIWFIAGSGPTAANQGSQFSPPIQITTPISLRDPQSAVLVPSGIMFKAETGFYLLDRSLQVERQSINGSAADAFSADVVMAATTIPGTTQVRFLVASGVTLLYDYEFQQWCEFTNHNGVSAAIFDGVYCYMLAQTNVNVYQENPGSYLDNTTPIVLFGQTAWLGKPFGSVQAYARVWKTFFKGNFPQGCAMRITLAVNYNNAPVDIRILDAAGVLPTMSQIRYDNAVQLCESFQLTIEDTNPSGSASWSLDAIDFEVGVRKGAFKNPTPQRVG